MNGQGLPIHTGHGMADLRTLEVAPDGRPGGKTAFVQLHGIQGITAVTSERLRREARSNPSAISTKK
jgi:hypothetical protein